ncbi:MAG: orotate phosphoribosyltransferase [Actinomycetota bacterium]|nr:orotate phosphoribosyltransferase [Actinomycetota bacterium]
MTREELRAALREHAYLEGEFVLRSGRRSAYYLDKYRFATQPDVLRAVGAALAAAVAELEPEAARLAAPELGAVSLAAAASLAAGIPFLIVRKEEKGHGTRNRLEGPFAPGERVCLVEDVVTSGGAALAAIAALRAAALDCRTAVCVVDREEGGAEQLGHHGVRLHPLFRAAELREDGKSAANPHR